MSFKKRLKNCEPFVKKEAMNKKELSEYPFIKYLSDTLTPSCLFIDKQFNLLYVKGNAKQYLHASEDISHQNILKLLDSHSSEILKLGIQKLVKNKKNVRLKSIKLRTQNSVNVCDISITSINKTEELPECFAILFENEEESKQTEVINIDALKKAQEQLSLSESRYKLAMDAAEEGIWDWDLVHNSIYYSNQWKKQLGYLPDELENVFETWELLLHPDDLLASQKALSSYLEKPIGHYLTEFRMRHRDTSYRWIRSKASAIQDKHGNVLRLLGAHTDITFTKKAQTEIANAKQRFELTNKASNTGIWDWNIVTNDLFLSDVWKAQLGFSPKELPNDFSSWKDRLHPDDQDMMVNYLNNYLQHPTIKFNLQFRLRHKNNSYRWINSKASATITNGQVVRLFGAHNDITEIIEASEKLKENEEHLRTILNTMSDSLVIADKSGNIVEQNDAVTEVYGYTKEELNKFNALNMVTDEYRSEQKVFIENVMKDDFAQYEAIHKRKDGSTFNAEIRGRSIIYNNQQCIMAIIRDVSVRKKNEHEILKLNQAIQQAPVPIVTTDPNGIIEYVNPRFIEITGYASQELLGQKTSILQSGYHSTSFYTELWDRIKSGKSWRGEFLNKKKNTEYFWELASISPILNHKGEIQNFIKISEDITKNKQIEIELKSAMEKAEVANIHKNNFLANMSHEIRTPMNGIIGFAELLKEDDIAPLDKEKYLEIIHSNSNSLLRLIDDIIDISKIEANELKISKKETNISKLLDEFNFELNKMKTQKGKAHIETKLVKPVKLENLIVYTDPLRLKQLLVNFTNNALKFTEKGTITTECIIHSKSLEFIIHDTGIGIPEKHKTELFKRFQRIETKAFRRFGGTGLGLAISKGIVELLGGKVWLNSVYGKGSSFHFTIPLNQEVINETTNKNTIHNAHILLAEDEQNIYSFFKEALGDLAIKIHWAKNGKEAVDMFKKHRADIDLILMDINMPVMDGIEATKNIMRLDPSAKIIIETCLAKEDELQSCNDLGCIDYLTKPILPNDLIAKISKHL